MEKTKETNRPLAGLLHGDQQPRLAMEADVKSDTNTRKRAEDAAADQAKHGNRCFAKRVGAGPTSLASLGKIAKPPLAPKKCISDALVDKNATAPKPCLSPEEMRTLTAAGGLHPTGIPSTAMTTIFPRPCFSWSLGETKKHTSRTNNQLAPFGWWRVIQTISRQTRVQYC